jgi:hypothetical protein
MIPRFSLPPGETGNSFYLATKPKQVEAWLTRLPMASPLSAGAELADYLATCVRLRLSPDELEEILDQVMPPASSLVEALKERFVSDNLPPPPNRQQAAELCCRLMLEIGYICKLIILIRIGKRLPLFAAKPLDRHAYILMLALNEVLDINLDTHQSPPPGVWQDMHQTYQFAIDNGWGRLAPPGFGHGLSLEDIYKYALLLDIADPYRIPKEDLEATQDIVLKHCMLANLVPVSDAGPPGSVFVIDRDSDSPASLLPPDQKSAPGRWHLALDTAPLVKRISLLASQHALSIKPANLSETESMANLAHLESLNRLKAQWGGSVRRLGGRHPRYEATMFEAVFGLKAVRKLLGVSEPGVLVSALAAPSEPTTCLLVNDSVGGLALSRERPLNFQLRIGELAAVRQLRTERWSVGIIRWFRSTRAGKAIFGLQLLAPSARAVRMQRIEDDSIIHGLWLPATPSLRQSEMVLCQSGKLAVGAVLTLFDENETVHRIRLDQLVEFTPTLEAYRYRPV